MLIFDTEKQIFAIWQTTGHSNRSINDANDQNETGLMSNSIIYLLNAILLVMQWMAVYGNVASN